MARGPDASGRRTNVFQDNPETVKRSHALRYTGAPVETIDLDDTLKTLRKQELSEIADSNIGSDTPGGEFQPAKSMDG